MAATQSTRPAVQLSMGLRNFSAEDPGGWEAMLQVARVADDAGLDRLVVSDHVVFGEHREEYGRPEVGGTAGGQQPTGPDGQWLEPLTTLTFVAGMTSHVRLGTNILIAALRRPVVLAKSLSTLDALSRGRIDLGVGVGWQREEYDAAGLEFDGRGRLLDHTLEVCQTLWSETRADYDSPELTFENIHQMPKPLQPGGVPIWIGGTVNQRTSRRLARFGSGWIPWGPDAKALSESIPRMRQAVADQGGDADALQVVGNLPIVKLSDGGVDLDRTMEAVPTFAEAGVTDLRVHLALPSERDAALEHLSGVVAAFREAAGRPGHVA
ncbi:LLM class F420-dependent oxidoreductase [soil metagenome]